MDNNLDKFVEKVNIVRQRAIALQQHTSQPSLLQADITSFALQELETALEELHVAEEELHQQNDELQFVRVELEAERQRYRDLFEFAPDGYLVTNDAGIIEQANRAVAGLLNVSQQYLIGKPLINYIPFEQRPNFRSKLKQVYESDCIKEWEISISPRDGVAFDTAITISTVRDLSGKATGWRWLLRDITARKQAEEKIRNIQLQNLQLQESARLKSHFLAIVSHELRSPMNAIIGFSQLLLRQPYNSLAPNQQNMVERILNSGKHLLTLIDDILDFSKIEASQLKLRLEEFNLAEVITATTEELLSLVEQKNLELQVKLNLQNPCVVNDKTRLRQILVNLLSNAIKFTKVGTISVEVCELAENRLAIAVKDTGIGITEADIKHIFEEFRQVNQTLTREYGGTGLGLAITNRLVHMMQGNITVESQLGQGSTFCVELPRHVTTLE